MSQGTVTLGTACLPLAKARTVNQTSATFVSKAITATEPVKDAGTATGTATIEARGNANGSESDNALLVQPYGIGSENNTFSLRVFGWNYTGTNPDTKVWVPVLLCELLCTLSASVGLAGKEILDTERLADTITLTYGNANVSIDIISPANDLPAHALLDFKGSQKIELTFSTGSSATSCNALVKRM